MKMFLIFLTTIMAVFAQAQTTGGTVAGSYTPGFYSTTNYVKNSSCNLNTSNITAGTGMTVSRVSSASGALFKSGACKLSSVTAGATADFPIQSLTTETGLIGQNCEVKAVMNGLGSHWSAQLMVNGAAAGPLLNTIPDAASAAAQSVGFNVPCGGVSDIATSPYKVRFTKLDTTSADVQVANVYFGLATNIAQATQAIVYGSVVWPASSSSTPAWSSSATSFSNMGVTTSTQVPVYRGAASAPSTKVPGLFFASMPAGDYEITVNAQQFVQQFDCEMRVSDGTNFTNSVGFTMQNSGNFVASTSSMVFHITYASPQSNVTLQLQSGSPNAGACTSRGFYNDWEMNVKYFPSKSQQLVRADQTDTDWVDFAPTTTNASGTLAVTAAHDCQWMRSSSNMLIRCKYAMTSPTASEFRFAIPNGNTVDANRVGSTAFVSSLMQNTNTSAPIRFITMSPGNNYLNMSLYAASGGGSPFTALAANSINSGDIFSFTGIVPITGWAGTQRAPVLVGGVTTASSGAERVERVYFGGTSATPASPVPCGVSPCATVVSSVPGVTVTRASAGNYNVNFPAGTFSAAPTCNVGVLGAYGPVRVDSVTATIVQIEGITPTYSGDQDQMDAVVCMGPR